MNIIKIDGTAKKYVFEDGQTADFNDSVRFTQLKLSEKGQCIIEPLKHKKRKLK
jgi:hypothetical protein